MKYLNLIPHSLTERIALWVAGLDFTWCYDCPPPLSPLSQIEGWRMQTWIFVFNRIETISLNKKNFLKITISILTFYSLIRYAETRLYSLYSEITWNYRNQIQIRKKTNQQLIITILYTYYYVYVHINTEE